MSHCQQNCQRADAPQSGSRPCSEAASEADRARREITGLIHQLKQRSEPPRRSLMVSEMQLDIRVLPVALADLAAQEPGLRGQPQKSNPSAWSLFTQMQRQHPVNRHSAGGVANMLTISLENINGVWSVVTPHQVYRFPSYRLARNFYQSLRKNLDLPTE